MSVDINNSDTYELCDATDRGHPRLLAAMRGSSNASFLTGDLVGYVGFTGGGPSSPPNQFTSILRTIDLTDGKTMDVASSPGIAWAAAWSPNRSMVAYFTDTGDAHHFWVKHGAALAAEVTQPIPLLGRGPSSDDQLLVAFSQDGQYVVFVDTFVYRLQVFRTSDNTAVYTAPTGNAGNMRTMATWSHRGDVLYFRNSSGVYRWDPANGISSFAAGLLWYNPRFSADDSFIAYTVVSPAHIPHVEIRDMGTQATVSTPQWRASPVFLTNASVLLEELAPCPPAGECGFYQDTLKSAVFHVGAHSETELGLSGWIMKTFWPHA